MNKSEKNKSVNNLSKLKESNKKNEVNKMYLCKNLHKMSEFKPAEVPNCYLNKYKMKGIVLCDSCNQPMQELKQNFSCCSICMWSVCYNCIIKEKLSSARVISNKPKVCQVIPKSKSENNIKKNKDKSDNTGNKNNFEDILSKNKLNKNTKLISDKKIIKNKSNDNRFNKVESNKSDDSLSKIKKNKSDDSLSKIKKNKSDDSLSKIKKNKSDDSRFNKVESNKSDDSLSKITKNKSDDSRFNKVESNKSDDSRFNKVESNKSSNIHSKIKKRNEEIQKIFVESETRYKSNSNKNPLENELNEKQFIESVPNYPKEYLNNLIKNSSDLIASKKKNVSTDSLNESHEPQVNKKRCGKKPNPKKNIKRAGFENQLLVKKY